MIARKLGVLAVTALTMFSLMGCSAVATDSGAPSLEEITASHFNDALFLMPARMDPNSSIESGFSIQADVSDKAVRMDFINSFDDVQVAIADAEAIVRGYDLAVLQACVEHAEDEGDEQLAQEWSSALEEDESSDGLGRIYDEYTLYIVLDNSDGTLDLTGFREAGSEGGINWQ